MKNKKFKEEDYFKMTTSVLINFMIYINDVKNTDLKFSDILEFQNWLINKSKINKDGKESI